MIDATGEVDWTDNPAPKQPIIYLTNTASLRSGPNFRGPGRVYNIMAKPRSFEVQDGRVAALAPLSSFLDAQRQGRLTLEDYKRIYEERVDHHLGQLAPGRLLSSAGPVKDGDTLICACSRDKAKQGKCHRAWAAEYLLRAGWGVVLDGERL